MNNLSKVFKAKKKLHIYLHVMGGPLCSEEYEKCEENGDYIVNYTVNYTVQVRKNSMHVLRSQ